MTKIRYNDLWDDDFELHAGRRARQAYTQKSRRRDRAAPQTAPTPDAAAEIAGGFQPTLSASKHEREWILNYLGAFHAEGILGDVLRKVKGGKEANVYCCQGHPDSGLGLLAAKVYRPRMFRQLRQDARYRQGRLLLDAEGKEVREWRLRRAVAKGTRFGHEVLHTSWIEHEYQALAALHQAGADVPQPIARSANTILMEYVGEVDEPAALLHEVTLEREEARALFDRLVYNIELMLSHGLVHADLSAYNVLYWEGAVKIIDFPQAVDVRRNPDAPDLLRRDVERLARFFARFGVGAEPAALAHTLWARQAGRGTAAERARQRALEQEEQDAEREG